MLLYIIYHFWPTNGMFLETLSIPKVDVPSSVKSYMLVKSWLLEVLLCSDMFLMWMEDHSWESLWKKCSFALFLSFKRKWLKERWLLDTNTHKNRRQHASGGDPRTGIKDSQGTTQPTQTHTHLPSLCSFFSPNTTIKILFSSLFFLF